MSISYHKELNVTYDVDVFIVGGGPAGVAAALAASTTGASTMLIEASSCLGGMGSNGLVPAFMPFSNGVDFLADGIGRMVLERMWKLGGKVKNSPYSIHLESLKRAYDELIEESRVTLLFVTSLIDIIIEDGFVKYAVCHSKSGIFAVKANTFIDATGDGDLCYLAGASYQKGDKNQQMMPATLCSLWSGIDWSKVIKPDNRALEAAFTDQVFTTEDRHLSGMWKTGNTLGGGNIGHCYQVDGTDEVSLTKGLIHGRKIIKEFEKYYKEYLQSGYENMELVATGFYLGIRETRRILCDYTLSFDDFKKRADFEDEIGRFSYPVDIHPSDQDKESFQKFLKEYHNFRYKKGESYGIPYRSLIPKRLNNVLVAGRCMGTDRYMQSSIRVMPGCYITGQACGIAASLAAKNNCTTREVPLKKLQQLLVDIGGFLPNYKK